MSKSIRVLVIPVDGPVRVEVVKEASDMNRLLDGGDLEHIRIAEDAGAYVDEYGIDKQLEFNERATYLCTVEHVGLMPGDFIKGTMVLFGCGNPMEDADEQDVPERYLKAFDLN